MTNAAKRSRASFSQRLYSAANLPEAHLVRGLLADGRSRRPASRDTCTSLYVAGIEARVFNEYAGGALGELPFTETAPSVWIEEERDLARARQVVATYENAAVAPGSTRCGACGERVREREGGLVVSVVTWSESSCRSPSPQPSAIAPGIASMQSSPANAGEGALWSCWF